MGFGYFTLYLMHFTETNGCYDGEGNAILKAFIAGI